MFSRSKTLVLLMCLFLISFKVVASGIFIQVGLERAHQFSGYGSSISAQQAQDNSESDSEKQPTASTLNLMSHITAHLSEDGVTVFAAPYQLIKFGVANDSLHTQNYPDSAFKPPKANA